MSSVSRSCRAVLAVAVLGLAPAAADAPADGRFVFPGPATTATLDQCRPGLLSSPARGAMSRPASQSSAETGGLVGTCWRSTAYFHDLFWVVYCFDPDGAGRYLGRRTDTPIQCPGVFSHAPAPDGLRIRERDTLCAPEPAWWSRQNLRCDQVSDRLMCCDMADDKGDFLVALTRD